MIDFTNCNHCRDAYAETLLEIGKKNQKIVVLDSDVSNSTKTIKFGNGFPDRFFDIGIAEQNLINIAAGLSLSGKIPFVSTFAIFGTGRAWEQIRNTVAFDSLTVNLVMTHAGLSLGGDGATHQSLEDIAIMQVIPNMQVIVPADVVETRSVIHYASEMPGPKYIRLSRRRTLNIFEKDNYSYDPLNYPIIEDGADVTIFANGCMIREALKACYELKKQQISAEIVNLHTIKPLANNSILKSVKKAGCVVSIEEHSIIGGMGSAIAEVISQNYPVPMKIIGVQDRFGGSGSTDELYQQFGLTSENIIKSVHEVIKMRKK